MTYECRHIMHNGTKCESPALRGKPYCYNHERFHRYTAAPTPGPMDTIQLPVLEDRSAILIALSKVLNGLASGRLDPRRVGLFLYGLQIATQIVDHKSDIVPSRTVDSVTQTDTGEELGPEKQMCNDENCPDCPERDTCEFCNLEEEDDEGNEEEVKAQPHPRTLTAAQHLLLAVNRILPTVHGTASTAHRSLSTAHCSPHRWRCPLIAGN
jgi:hypothetical protein